MVLNNFLFVPVCLSQCPLTWQNKWEGPEEPMQYLRAVVTRALAIEVTQHACVYIKTHILDSLSLSVSLPFFQGNKTPTGLLLSVVNKKKKTVVAFLGDN